MDQVWGLKAQLYTYDLEVRPDIHHAFTASHVYMWRNYDDAFPFCESGVYRGAGAGSHPIDTDHPRYYVAWGDYVNSYQEEDASSVPEIGTYKYYRVKLDEYDSITQMGTWSVYYNDMSTPVDTFSIWQMPAAHAVCGGEVSGSSGTVLKAHGIPDVHIRKQDGNTYDWNETNFPSTWKHLQYQSWTLAWPNSPDYQTFTASGTKP